ncbi:ATPase [Rhodobacteraceae bacterium 2CG4]|uniref:ATPase n=1 Tax=Halovulum marinum TaxID=2662447 RepID=A0A6L5Z5C4_9RHOB|nr:ATP12 family protein [Halovulum marinum]MSU91617.1 ATPase [Halovulum marinum]
MTPPHKRRFWNTVAVRAAAPGFEVTLDQRPLRTPAKAALVLPCRPLAEAVAQEWDAQGAEIRPQDMPLTRAANAAIDKVSVNRAAVAEMLSAYGATDLLCYRAEAPEGLVERQIAAWDPWLNWAEAEMSAPLLRIAGVMHAPQPEPSLRRLADAVAGHDAFEMTALHDLVTLTGSLVLGLAVSRGALSADAAWTASRVDETWQEELWGRDAEAHALAEERRGAVLVAGQLLSLLRGTEMLGAAGAGSGAGGGSGCGS